MDFLSMGCIWPDKTKNQTLGILPPFLHKCVYYYFSQLNNYTIRKLSSFPPIKVLHPFFWKSFKFKKKIHFFRDYHEFHDFRDHENFCCVRSYKVPTHQFLGQYLNPVQGYGLPCFRRLVAMWWPSWIVKLIKSNQFIYLL